MEKLIKEYTDDYRPLKCTQAHGELRSFVLGSTFGALGESGIEAQIT